MLIPSLFFVYMRLHDGPVEFVPWFTISTGGPFRSGQLLPSPKDWTFLKNREEIEMETLNLGTTKTIWTMVVMVDCLWLVADVRLGMANTETVAAKSRRR